MSVMSVMDECMVEGTWEVCMDFFLTCICRFIQGTIRVPLLGGYTMMGATPVDEEGSLIIEV